VGPLRKEEERVLKIIDEKEVVDLAVAMGNITAPSGHEQPMADFVLQWLKDNGFNDSFQQKVAEAACEELEEEQRELIIKYLRDIPKWVDRSSKWKAYINRVSMLLKATAFEQTTPHLRSVGRENVRGAKRKAERVCR